MVPAIAGPAARPTALILVATPFSVPKILKLTALFVNKIVVQGKAKIVAKHLISMMRNMTISWVSWFGISAVNGVVR